MTDVANGTGTAAVRAFLIADIRGYTTFTRERGDEEAGRLASRFASIARDAVADAGGRVVELRGDEALCVFDSPRQALRTAIAMQRGFADALRDDPSLPLRVGIGLDAGEAVAVEGGFRGGALNLAARLSSLARAGEVLAGDGIVLMAGQVDGLSYSDRGRVRVKGFANPVRVHRLEFELELPPETAAPRRGKLLRSRRGLVAAVALAVAAAAGAVAAFVVLSGDGEAGGVAADSAALLDPKSGHVLSESSVGETPVAVVSNEAAAWTLDADAQTISRVSRSGGRALTKAAGFNAASLALGGDLLWAAYVDRRPTGSRVGVAVFDPSTLTLRAQRLLPGVGPNIGEPPKILYAHGAVWISGPTQELRKIDPVSHDVVDNVGLGGPALGLASDATSIWATVGGKPLQRIDPRTLRPERVIRLATPEAGPIATGASSIWVGDSLTGNVWRVEPGPPVQTHTIRVGLAAASVAFGDGAAWVASPIEGRVVRIDAATESLRSIELDNAPVAVSVAPEGVWAAVAAGGGRSITASPKLEGLETLPEGTCRTPVYGGGGRPDFLIVSDLPMQSFDAPVSLSMVQAIEFVLRRHGFRAGRYAVAYQACDDATAAAGSFTAEKCVANVKRYVATESVIGMIGPVNSGCAVSEIPIANRARPGPLPIVSPTASYVGLARKGAGVSPGHPEGLYPTGTRNFVRVYPPDDAQGAADALLAKRLGVRHAYVFLDNPDESYGATLAYAFSKAARRLGIRVIAPESPRSSRFDSVATDLRRARVDGVFVAGMNDERSADFIRAARRGLGRRAVLIGPDAFVPAAAQAHDIGPAAVGMYVSGGVVTQPSEQLPPAGRRFTKAFSATQQGRNVNIFAPYAAQAAEVLLRAIARSDGTRASVARGLLRVRLADSVFGPFSFDGNGEPTTNLIPIFRVVKTARYVLYPEDRVVTVIHVPGRLMR